MRRKAAFAAIAIAIASLAGGCSNRAKGPAGSDPFALAEIHRRTAPVGLIGAHAQDVVISSLRDQESQLAHLYEQALGQFDSIYGAGVGPAKGAPQYLECREAFDGVEGQVRPLARPLTDAELQQLWARLKACREAAIRWSEPAEMATFGHDLGEMTSSAMLVLSYTVTIGGSRFGPQMYRDATR